MILYQVEQGYNITAHWNYLFSDIYTFSLLSYNFVTLNGRICSGINVRTSATSIYFDSHVHAEFHYILNAFYTNKKYFRPAGRGCNVSFIPAIKVTSQYWSISIHKLYCWYNTSCAITINCCQEWVIVNFLHSRVEQMKPLFLIWNVSWEYTFIFTTYKYNVHRNESK